ncbi:hypothetical protein GCM10027321_06240 [Massilia terrae]|uniref:Transmembrane protein n=1 Tax=Massilia terrae TaxID=1811224 RepID=A0ABT2CSQ2_9BURK|nr:hypothetical protein [Massilia terrae]MCS0657017.1 hypothetical protein [Massilia terrae]
MSSPVNAAVASPMPAWGKTALLVGLLFIGCWGAAILYWRITDRMPTAGELAFCLVGAPLLVTSGVWLSRRMLEQRATPSPASAPVAASAAGDRGLLILDSALRLPCGSSAEEVYAAIRSNKARPDLDRELLDDDGFPVMTARCALADDESLRDEIAEWMAANGLANAEFIDEHWRALVLATQVVDDLASAIGTKTQTLHLQAIAPEDWTCVQRRAAGAWMVNVIIQTGWPADRITQGSEATGSERLAEILNRLAVSGETAVLTMVVAFASNVGDQTVARWSEDRTLFTSSNSNGRIPGEGAAGLLVSDLLHAPEQTALPHAVLHQVEEDRRDTAADNLRNTDSKLLTDLAVRAIDRAQLKATELAAIVSDTGHRPNRVLEMMALASAISSELDTSEDVIRTGAACCDCSAVPSLAAVILAQHCACKQQKPIAWASNEDAMWRAVAIVRPEVVQSSE